MQAIEIKKMKGYKKIDFWGINNDIAIRLTVFNLIAALVFFWLFESLYLWMAGGAQYSAFVSGNEFLSGAFWIFLYFATLVVHELFHGLFVKIFGGKPKYGAALASKVLPVFYCTEKNGTSFNRKQFILILAAPLVAISSLGIILMVLFPFLGPFLILSLVANSSGAVGDLWMVSVLLKYPKHIEIIDKKDGIEIYGTKNDKSINLPHSGFMNMFFRGFMGSLVFLIFVIMLFLPILLNSLNADSFHIGARGESFFTIYDYRAVGSTGAMESGVSFLPLIFFSILSGLIYTIIKSTRQK